MQSKIDKFRNSIKGFNDWFSELSAFLKAVSAIILFAAGVFTYLSGSNFDPKCYFLECASKYQIFSQNLENKTLDIMTANLGSPDAVISGTRFSHDEEQDRFIDAATYIYKAPQQWFFFSVVEGKIVSKGAMNRPNPVNDVFPLSFPAISPADLLGPDLSHLNFAKYDLNEIYKENGEYCSTNIAGRKRNLSERNNIEDFENEFDSNIFLDEYNIVYFRTMLCTSMTEPSSIFIFNYDRTLFSTMIFYDRGGYDVNVLGFFDSLTWFIMREDKWIGVTS